MATWDPNSHSEIDYPDVEFPGTYSETGSTNEWEAYGAYLGDVLVLTAPTADDLSGPPVSLSSITLPADLAAPRRIRVNNPWKTKVISQFLQVRPGAKPRTCGTYSDYKNVRIDANWPYTNGDTRSVVATTLHSRGTQSSFYDDGSQTIIWRDYRTCDKATKLSVGFVNGHAYAKHYISSPY